MTDALTHRPRGFRRVGSVPLVAAGALALIGSLVVGGYAVRNLYSFSWRWSKVERAGYAEKQVTVNGTVLNYGEGPASGRTPLLLIHGQGSDWKTYAPVLVELAKTYHVYAVDVPGHGRSGRLSEGYAAVALGADLTAFIEQVIGEPAVVSGHSSGGQLAAWLAANAPEQVSAVMLEDPPMFTTLLRRAQRTWNWNDLATACHTFLASGGTDFVAHYWKGQYMWKYFGNSAEFLRQQGLAQRAKHPAEPLRLWWWPANDFFRSLEGYDPRFGDAFYTGAWDTGFDHEATLRGIHQPTIFVHTKVSYDGEILRGATDDEDAARIAALLPNGELVKSQTGHGFHTEDPDHFVRLMEDLRR